MPCVLFPTAHTAYVWTNATKVSRNSERTMSQSESSDSPTLLPFPRSFPVTWNTVSMFKGKKLTAQVVKWIVFSATHMLACFWPLCQGSQTESYKGKALLFLSGLLCVPKLTTEYCLMPLLEIRNAPKSTLITSEQWKQIHLTPF